MLVNQAVAVGVVQMDVVKILRGYLCVVFIIVHFTLNAVYRQQLGSAN